MPIVAVQVGLMLMGVVDVIMVGRLSAVALAAVAIANIYMFTFTIFGMGVLMALDPIISQALGAADNLAVKRGLQRGMALVTGCDGPGFTAYAGSRTAVGPGRSAA